MHTYSFTYDKHIFNESWFFSNLVNTLLSEIKKQPYGCLIECVFIYLANALKIRKMT